MLNIGRRPTVGGKNKTIEVHIFNFNEDIYDSELCIEFVSQIRKEQKFNSIDELKAQLKADEEEAHAELSKL